nr:polysaccharide pyruvyl transferase family protein [Raineyella antarctica]
MAEAAGYTGQFYMLGDPVQGAPQSEATGIGLLAPLLSHPNTRYSPKSNLHYGPLLVLVWGAIALVDTVKCMILLTTTGRAVLRRFLTLGERKTLKVMEESDICFVKGGGFIHSTNSITDPYRAFYLLFHVFLAQSLGKPVYVMPNSFGPFKGALYRFLVRGALNRCSVVTARESISQKALSAIGVESQLYPDLAFSLDSLPLDESPIRSIRQHHGSKPVVGITARPYRFPHSPDPAEAYARYLDEMAKLVAWLSSHDFIPVLIEHVIAGGEHESDISAIKAITHRLSGVDYEVVSQPTYTCRELKALYGECDYVIGTRFHSVIFALSEGVPALAIAYGGNKGKGIMRDAGLSRFAIDIEAFRAEAASELFSELVDEPELRDHLVTLRKDCGDRHAELAQLIRRAYP